MKLKLDDKLFPKFCHIDVKIHLSKIYIFPYLRNVETGRVILGADRKDWYNFVTGPFEAGPVGLPNSPFLVWFTRCSALSFNPKEQ